MRLIDADALMVSENECQQREDCTTCRMFIRGCEDFAAVIEAAPTIEERKDDSYKIGYADGYHKAENDYHAKAESDRDKAFKAGLEIGKAERKAGRWRRRLVDGGFNADWHCSECGWRTSLEEHGYYFCPNCGADMRGKQDGKNT